MMPGFRQLASVIASRVRLAQQAGITFDGKRDLYAALGFQRELRPKDFRDRFRRGGIAARIVDAYPNATWRGGGELIEDEDPETVTTFEEVWQELNERLKLWTKFRRVDILAGLGQYAVMLIGGPGRFEEPLPDSFKPEQLLYVTPLGEDDATIGPLVTTPYDPRFGQPEFYKLKRISPIKGQETQVHYSRILHVVDGALDDDLYGTPRLERCWNDCDSLEKIVGGGSEAFWKRVYQGLQLDIDKDMDISEPAKKELQEQIDEYEHGLRRVFRTRGVEVTPLTSDVSDFKNQVMAVVSLISGATGIPQRILLGSERGELASSQDKDNWDERVGDRRAEWAEPTVVRPFADLLIERGVLPEPKEYKCWWPEIDNLDETQRAEIANQWAALNQKTGETVVTPAEIRDNILGLEPLDDEDLLDEEPEPVVPPVPQPPPATPLPVGEEKAAARRLRALKALRAQGKQLRARRARLGR